MHSPDYRNISVTVAESTNSRRIENPRRDHLMKRTLQALIILALMATAGVRPAAAQNRYIVRTNGGLSSVLRLCLSANWQVQGSLDGQVSQTVPVTSSGGLPRKLLNGN